MLPRGRVLTLAASACRARLRSRICLPALATHAARSLSSSATLPAAELIPKPLGTAAPSLGPLDTFARRHIGPREDDLGRMLASLKPPVASVDELIGQAVPENVRTTAPAISEPLTESELLGRLREIAGQNSVLRSFIGCGYTNTFVPEVVRRNILESPAWYTSYTPYQAEISQGRLESLLNFQTVVADLTGLPAANASVLDEATAAAEALTMATANRALGGKKTGVFVVSGQVHPQTADVLRARADGFGVKLVLGDVLADNCRLIEQAAADAELVGVLVQYPNTAGGVSDFRNLADKVHAHKGLFCVSTDLLALTLLTPPGEFGADIAVGSAQRLGVPMGFGGPHAGFLAARSTLQRRLPGRIVGVSKDRMGNRALRLALQTREQHIRREKATSNICTAQALLANMAAMYAVYHGPDGLRQIAESIVAKTQALERKLSAMGFAVGARGEGDIQMRAFFDTLVVADVQADDILQAALQNGINLRRVSDSRVGITLDETVTEAEIATLADIFRRFAPADADPDVVESAAIELPEQLIRTSAYLTSPVFNTHRSETQLLRYIHRLQNLDLSLAHSMIPLGSCTMKLNATTEMAALSLPEFTNLHPFVPADQAAGYSQLINELSGDLAAITGLPAVSIQPNSGAQGEFAGLRAIRAFHEAAGQEQRDVCLIPVSAHGTNPASAAMAGLRVVAVKCLANGDLDMADLESKCVKHADSLAAIMITYPSTYGRFDAEIKDISAMAHKHDGLVYLDGANMNAQIGLTSPAEVGADVCHLNLHKTFCIPHGGGGPGVGPIAVSAELAPYLPGHVYWSEESRVPKPAHATAAVSAAPFGSASILPISWAYIKMMGSEGLTKATTTAILNANYLLSKLKGHYTIMFQEDEGGEAAGADPAVPRRCAHEFIIDFRPLTKATGVTVADVAKRLQDYSFHAPTMAWPVAGTMMVEPTESEGVDELDRFAEAMIAIRAEIGDVEAGRIALADSPLVHAPHPVAEIVRWAETGRKYSAAQAAFPAEYLHERKFWPPVARVDDAHGDRNLVCTCPPMEEIAEG